MSVVPIQPRLLVQWNMNFIVEGLSRHGNHVQNIVLGSLRRNTQSMKVKIRHVHARANRALLARWLWQIIHVGDSQGVSWRNTNDRWYRLSVESKAVPAITPAHRMKSQSRYVTV